MLVLPCLCFCFLYSPCVEQEDNCQWLKAIFTPAKEIKEKKYQIAFCHRGAVF